MSHAPKTIESIQVHEAGHAVVGHALGLAIFSVEAPSSHPECMGHVLRAPPHQPAAGLISTLAGPIAESKFTGADLDFQMSQDDDGSDYQKICRGIQTMLEANPNAHSAEGLVAAALAYATQMVDEQWPEILYVAGALRRYGGTLSGETLDDVLGPLPKKTYVFFAHQNKSTPEPTFSSPEAQERVTKSIRDFYRRNPETRAPASGEIEWDWVDPRDTPTARQEPRRFNYKRDLFFGRGAKAAQIPNIMYK